MIYGLQEAKVKEFNLLSDARKYYFEQLSSPMITGNRMQSATDDVQETSHLKHCWAKYHKESNNVAIFFSR